MWNAQKILKLKSPHGRAVFSHDREFRYVLSRNWSPEMSYAESPYCTFIGVNPSIADHLNDDPTIRRCVFFAKKFGFGGMHMVNLFAKVSTNPKGIMSPEDIGEYNNRYILNSTRVSTIICAWGCNGTVLERDKEVLDLLSGKSLWCLGVNLDDTPKHPLYLPKTAKLIAYT